LNWKDRWSKKKVIGMLFQEYDIQQALKEMYGGTINEMHEDRMDE